MLKEQLMEDLKDAMKNKDELKKNTVTMIRAAIKQIEVDKRVELNDDEVIEIISKEAKKRKDAIVEFEKAGRQDLIDQTNAELELIKSYLPEQLSVEELTSIIEETIKEVGAETMKDMGKVMQAVKTKTAGRADGKTINEIVKAKLS